MALLKLLNEREPLTSEEAGAALSISGTSAWRALEALEKEGQVVQTKAATPAGRRYLLKR